MVEHGLAVQVAPYMWLGVPGIFFRGLEIIQGYYPVTPLAIMAPAQHALHRAPMLGYPLPIYFIQFLERWTQPVPAEIAVILARVCYGNDADDVMEAPDRTRFLVTGTQGQLTECDTGGTRGKTYLALAVAEEMRTNILIRGACPGRNATVLGNFLIYTPQGLPVREAQQNFLGIAVGIAFRAICGFFR
jgi:hypothetical protein